MEREALKRLIVGPIATVPTPFDEDYEVDYGRMAELTKWWVESGLVKGKAVIKVAAAMGEGPMLSDHEWPALLRTTVQAADDKAAIVCGLHYKDTKRTIEDARRAQDLGAIALQVCPPIFNLPSQDDLLDFYGDLSDAIDVGIMVYVTTTMNCPVDVETYRRMTDIRNIVAIKWSPFAGENAYEDIFEFVDVWNIIDNSLSAVRCHKLGGHGYINHTSEIYPPHDLEVWDLMENGRYEEAQALLDSVNVRLREVFQKVAERTGGQGIVKKGMMAVMGRPCGVSRPPSKPINEEELAELRDVLKGAGWPVSDLVQ